MSIMWLASHRSSMGTIRWACSWGYTHGWFWAVCFFHVHRIE